MKITARFFTIFVLLNTTPLLACSPAFNSAYPAMLSSWVIWLALACFMTPKDRHIKESLIPWFLFPISFALFMIPLPSWIAFLNSLFFISFAVSNILEFLAALQDKDLERGQRKRRLLFFGIPTLCLVIAGFVFRGLYYTSAAGVLSVLMDKGILLYSGFLLAGIIIFVYIDRRNGKDISQEEEENIPNELNNADESVFPE